MTPPNQNRGSLAVEVVLLVPVLMLLVMFIVFVGTVQSASLAVRHAADVGARTGSVAHSNDATRRAHNRTSDELSRSSRFCVSRDVHTELRKINGQVVVTAVAQCVVRMQGLSMLGVSGPVVRASSSEVIDHFRSHNENQ